MDKADKPDEFVKLLPEFKVFNCVAIPVDLHSLSLLSQNVVCQTQQGYLFAQRVLFALSSNLQAGTAG